MGYMLRTTGHSVACERVRAQVSLEVDGELSQLERAMLAAHVLRCDDCHAYRERVHSFTRELRTAPLAQPTAHLLVRRPRRVAAVSRFQAGVAAAMAFAVVGVASHLAVPQRTASEFRSVRVIHFQTQTELEQELALLGVREGSFSSGPGEATAR